MDCNARSYARDPCLPGPAHKGAEPGGNQPSALPIAGDSNRPVQSKINQAAPNGPEATRLCLAAEVPRYDPARTRGPRASPCLHSCQSFQLEAHQTITVAGGGRDVPGPIRHPLGGHGDRGTSPAAQRRPKPAPSCAGTPAPFLSENQDQKTNANKINTRRCAPEGHHQFATALPRRRRSAVPVASGRVSYRTWNVSTAFAERIILAGVFGWHRPTKPVPRAAPRRPPDRIRGGRWCAPGGSLGRGR